MESITQCHLCRVNILAHKTVMHPLQELIQTKGYTSNIRMLFYGFCGIKVEREGDQY